MPTATLPHWETTPADLPAAIREIKAALRARIEASGRTVEEVFAVVEARDHHARQPGPEPYGLNRARRARRRPSAAW